MDLILSPPMFSRGKARVGERAILHMTERERERQTDRERERETDRETDRQREREREEEEEEELPQPAGPEALSRQPNTARTASGPQHQASQTKSNYQPTKRNLYHIL